MARYNRSEDFVEGVGLLTPFFTRLGYDTIIGTPKLDKEGTSYSARFVRSARSVEILHLYSVSPPNYKIGMCAIDHVEYIDALGVGASSKFPCYADDALSGYSALLHDLEGPLAPFFHGSEDEFCRLVSNYSQTRVPEVLLRRPKGGTSEDAEDRRTIAMAKDKFREGRYDEVLVLQAQLNDVGKISATERQLFAIARKRNSER